MAAGAVADGSTLDALAPPPYGLKLKLRRARKQLRQLRRVFELWVASNPCSWRRQLNADGTHYVYSLHFAQQPDVTQILTDEAVHHLRSILDHLLTALIELQGGDTTSAQFPAHLEKPKTTKEKAEFERRIGNLRGLAREVIVQAQPYHRGEAARSHPLWILTRLDNRFKHTSLHLYALQVGIPVVPGLIQPPPPFSGVRENGDVFAVVPIDVNVETDFEPNIHTRIAFRVQRTGLEGIGIDTLEEIYNYVRDELLAKVVEGPWPERLPSPASTPIASGTDGIR